MIAISSLAKGDVIGETTYAFSRDTLVRYAGASGDFNPIHYNVDFAKSVGLDGVIAHGMLTMGTVVNLVSEWVGSPALIADYVCRFTNPIVVPPHGEAVIAVQGKVGALDEDANTARIDLTATHEGAKVLGKCQVTVRFLGS